MSISESEVANAKPAGPSRAAWINRGNNLLPVAVLAAIAIANIPEFPHEGKLNGWLDEAAIALIAVAVVVWYQRNSLRRSFIPILALVGALGFKILAIFIEDKDDIGDDIGQASLFIALLVIVGIIHYRSRSLADGPETMP